MKNNLKWTIAGVLLGAGAGFLYWNFIGCSSGSCMITSVWYRSTLYGALMGGLFANSFGKPKPKSVELNTLHPDESKLNSEKEKTN
ncbi:MAG: hypothetical protein IPG90_15630 [Bacteroidetes bacterium]|nr:hypothetical protein [Bacteroidota bacterium]